MQTARAWVFTLPSICSDVFAVSFAAAASQSSSDLKLIVVTEDGSAGAPLTTHLTEKTRVQVIYQLPSADGVSYLGFNTRFMSLVVKICTKYVPTKIATLSSLRKLPDSNDLHLVVHGSKEK